MTMSQRQRQKGKLVRVSWVVSSSSRRKAYLCIVWPSPGSVILTSLSLDLSPAAASGPCTAVSSGHAEGGSHVMFMSHDPTTQRHLEVWASQNPLFAVTLFSGLLEQDLHFWSFHGYSDFVMFSGTCSRQNFLAFSHRTRLLYSILSVIFQTGATLSSAVPGPPRTIIPVFTIFLSVCYKRRVTRRRLLDHLRSSPPHWVINDKILCSRGRRN